MSVKKVEVDPVLTAATKAKDAALKARAKALHSTAVVHVTAQALASAQASAADYHLEADKAEAEAIRHADLARKALEESLGISAQDNHVGDQETPLRTAPSTPPSE